MNGKRETPNGPHVRLGARSAAQSRSVWHEPGRGREARYDPHFTTRSLVPCEIRDIRSSSPNSRAAHTRRRASAGETIELCYVRFLDTVTALVNTEATVRNPRRPRPRALTQAETLGPFTTYRCSVLTLGRPYEKLLYSSVSRYLRRRYLRDVPNGPKHRPTPPTGAHTMTSLCPSYSPITVVPCHAGLGSAPPLLRRQTLHCSGALPSLLSRPWSPSSCSASPPHVTAMPWPLAAIHRHRCAALIIPLAARP